jgi:hypothetical protein
MAHVPRAWRRQAEERRKGGGGGIKAMEDRRSGSSTELVYFGVYFGFGVRSGSISEVVYFGFLKRQFVWVLCLDSIFLRLMPGRHRIRNVHCRPGGFVKAHFVRVRGKGWDFNRTTGGCRFRSVTARSHNLCGAQINYLGSGLFSTGWYFKPVSPIH